MGGILHRPHLPILVAVTGGCSRWQARAAKVDSCRQQNLGRGWAGGGWEGSGPEQQGPSPKWAGGRWWLRPA